MIISSQSFSLGSRIFWIKKSEDFKIQKCKNVLFKSFQDLNNWQIDSPEENPDNLDSDFLWNL